MARTTSLIGSLINLCRDPGSKVGVVQKVAQDLDRVFAQLKASSDDLVAVETVENSGARITRSAAQSYATGVGAVVTWQTEVFDDGGWADIPGAPTKLTVPTGITRVVVVAGAEWASNGTGDRENSILKNGSTVALVRARACGTIGVSLVVSTGVIDVVAGDAFELRGVQDSGGALDFTPTASFLSAFALDP